MKYEWKYGENDCQEYYETIVDGNYLCVFANTGNPDTWMAMVNDKMIYDKTANDRQRKREGLAKGCHPLLLRRITLLSNPSPEYMMKKAEYCYIHGLEEISR